MHLKSAVAKDYMIFNFATEIAEILSIPTPDPLLRGEEYDIEFDKFNEEIAKEKVISGLTSDLNMPS